MFDTSKIQLKQLLEDAESGKLQLPDFQRDYVWGDEDVRGLIASIAKGFPIGALLTLEAGGEVSFQPRLLAGVPESDVEPEHLLLDGQQRVTSLYQSLSCKDPVKTRYRKKKTLDRYYYLRIEAALEESADIYDAILSVPHDRVLRSDFGKKIDLDVSTRELEYQQRLFPLNRSLDPLEWVLKWQAYAQESGDDVTDLMQAFNDRFLVPLAAYNVPLIKLDKSNSREAICLVFEKLNIGGKKLDTFELLTAIYAANQFDLRDAWNGIKKRLVGKREERAVLKPLENTEFLQTCTVLHTWRVRREREAAGVAPSDLPQISCKRPAMLGLPLEDFERDLPMVEAAYREAAEFMHQQNIIDEDDTPYPLHTVTLAAVFASLGGKPPTIASYEKLVRWFWCGALGEVYGSGGETRMAVDLPQLVAWLRGEGGPPKTVEDAIFQQNRLWSLRGKMSAAYKAIHALLMRNGCRDFITGKPTDLMTYHQSKIDIHHVFPRAWCIRQQIPKTRFNSILNKTPLSKRSNQIIGGAAPSIYLRKIESETGLSTEQLDEVLRSHLIEPQHLRNDDFEAFVASRVDALSGLVSDAMGKPVVLGAPDSAASLDEDENE
ncbi:hypothetical protein Mal64_34180 [Pseudobythopirellula maris]|uniref:GmrSD restriction endonucleases N-terminal domain-containing protein n=1 Tax=Pseudobythopirellula maris TaxID=2527991 RepID=A0A5C5ZIG2_9BACT|nr:DUF262 domain-containing protein [Pseudobythopirellula maris]TWT86591.1 hypothetical protein Mal64_34180 [Pseudobythopirellula maris]